MKKIINLLVPIIAISSVFLSSCKKNKDPNVQKVQLSFGDVHSEGVKKISLSEFSNVVANKENFIVVISSQTCSCWGTFQPIVNNYVKNNQLVCYHLLYSEMENVGFSFGLNKLSKSTTTFAIFENGSLKVDVNSNDNPKILEDASTFAKFMGENVVNPRCFFIKEADLTTLKSPGKSAVIYFERSECGDCTSLNPTLLKSYVKAHQNMNKLYVLDCQEFYAGQGQEGYETYLEKKDNFGMSTKYNTEYGYLDGKFPYFSLIENGEYASGAVIYNDTVNENKVITTSYYSQEMVAKLQYCAPVIEGKVLSESEVNRFSWEGVDYISWDRVSANSVYEGILNSFLDYALPKTNVNL